MQVISLLVKTKVSGKNQVVVPKGIRRALGLKKGDELIWRLKEVDGEVTAELMPQPKNWAKYMLGLGRETWKGVDAGKYINGLRNEWDR